MMPSMVLLTDGTGPTPTGEKLVSSIGSSTPGCIVPSVPSSWMNFCSAVASAVFVASGARPTRVWSANVENRSRNPSPNGSELVGQASSGTDGTPDMSCMSGTVMTMPRTSVGRLR